MAFTGATLHVGTPDFNVVDIDPSSVATALQGFVERGSKLTGVSLDDISTNVRALPPNQATVTLVDLLKLGMKLFDALVWLTAGRPSSHPLSIDSSIVANSIPSMQDIAKSVFYVYFFLVTQARYPVGRSGQNPPKVPNFLSVVMGLSQPQSFYIDMLCTFNPTGFDAQWARHVEFDGFGQESLSRFGLGVAGYRLFGPFKLYRPTAPVPANLQHAFEFACTVAIKPPTWDVHPLTRNPNVLTARGNLNKNLGNLILDVYSDAQIDEMVAAKILFQKPSREPAYRNYLTWAPVDDISGSSSIFSS